MRENRCRKALFAGTAAGGTLYAGYARFYVSVADVIIIIYGQALHY